MSQWLRRRLVGGVLIGALCLALTGCNGSLTGTYHMEMGGFVLDFKGSTVTVSGLGESKTFDYKVDGDTITILKFDEGKDLELTRNSDGSLNSPIGTFRKKA